MTLDELRAEIARRTLPGEVYCCDSFDPPSTWCWKCIARLLDERTRESDSDRPLIVDDYHNAPSGVGPQADEWKNKPHRLIYDLCAEIRRIRGESPFRQTFPNGPKK